MSKTRMAQAAPYRGTATGSFVDAFTGSTLPLLGQLVSTLSTLVSDIGTGDFSTLDDDISQLTQLLTGDGLLPDSTMSTLSGLAGVLGNVTGSGGASGISPNGYNTSGAGGASCGNDTMGGNTGAGSASSNTQLLMGNGDDSYSQAAKSMPSASDVSKLSDGSYNPPFPSSYSNQSYSTFSVNLYPEGSPSPEDINQHGIGDCGIVAQLASLAGAHPDFIKNMISEDPKKPGTYDVKMYDPTGKPITVAVDSQFMAGKDGKLTGVSGRNGEADWASVVEKAAAKYNTIYGTGTGQDNNWGGLGGWNNILPALVGPSPMSATQHYNSGTVTPSDAANIIQKALANGDMVGAGFSGLKTPTYFDGMETEGGHAYSVLGIVQHDGKQCVEMRNPWGTNTDSTTSTYNASTSGVLYVPIDEFVKDCDFGTEGGGAAASTGSSANGWTPPTQSLFTQDGGGLALDEGADKGKANRALTDQINEAVSAGDLTSFKSAYAAIVKAMGTNSTGGNNAEVLDELNTLSQNTQWKPDAGEKVIADNIQHAADALGAGDWNSGANAGDVQTFINDFNKHVSVATLNNDAKALGGDVKDTDLGKNVSAMVSQALGYASTHSDWAGSPSQSAQNSLIDAFNKAAGAAGEHSFTADIQDGWMHIKNDMSANNTVNLTSDLQWMLDHIRGKGHYNRYEQPVVDAINNIAKAYGITLS